MFHRQNTIITSLNAKPNKWASGYSVTVYRSGAVASATSADSTVPVYSDHGFAANDKLLLLAGGSIDEASYRTVASVTATQLTLSGATTLTVADGDVLINLGPDGGGASPDYDGSPITVYTDPGASGTATNATVTTNSEGTYEYWLRDGQAWELLRDGNGAPVAVVFLEDVGSPSAVFASASPSATDYTLATANFVPFRVTGASGATLVSIVPFDPEDDFAVLLRVGDRAQTTGDSGKLIYASASIDIDSIPGGDRENQAIYGISVYSGDSSSPQLGVHGISQGDPGSGKTLASIIGVQGFGTFVDEQGGTVTNLIGGAFQSQDAAAITGTISNMVAVLAKVGLRCTNVSGLTVTSAYGLHVQEPNNIGTQVTLTNLIGARIDGGGSNNVAPTNAYGLLINNPTPGSSKNQAIRIEQRASEDIEFVFVASGGTEHKFFWDESEQKFTFSRQLGTSSGSITSADDVLALGDRITVGNNTDQELEFLMNRATVDPVVGSRSETLAISSSVATIATSSLVPAGSVILAVHTKVTEAITGATSYDVGDGTDVDKWGATIDVALNTVSSPDDFTDATPAAGIQNVTLTANGANFTDGTIIVTAVYLKLV